MRILPILLVLILSATAAAAPTKGQLVLYRYDSTHVYAAVVTKVVSGNTVNLVAWSHVDAAWGDGNSADVPTIPYASVAMGACDDCWSAIAGQSIESTSTPSLTLNGSAVQLSTDHDVEYTATVKIANTLTLTGGSAGHVDLVCDASASPSTAVETVSAESTGSVVIGISLVTSSTGVLRWRVRAGDYCKLTTTNDAGTPSYTLIRQVAQTLQ